MNRNTRLAAAVLSLLFLLVPLAKAEDARWYKGNLHTHTLWSDGDDFPEMVAQWYVDHGYNFLGLSDHNILSQGEKWMPMRKVRERGGNPPIEKYLKRFPDVMKVRQSDQGEEVQLQPLDVVRKLVEKPGEFIMIQSEEITGNYDVPSGDPAKPKKLPVHMNATNIQELVLPAKGPSAREIMAANLKAIEEQSKRTGKPIVLHLNHPNFGWGVSAADLAAVIEERYFEVYNGHPGVRQTGDAEHMSMEKMWDVCNTIRIAQMNSKPLIGLATDDSHHYHVPGMSRSTSGRGWVMVRAKELTPDAITIAIRDGDFYSSSGVTLSDVSYDKSSKTIRLSIKPDGDATFTTQFIGTPRNFADGGKTPLDSEKVGTVLKTQEGSSAEYTLTGDELYVRALVTSSKAPENPSYEGQKQQAWTQPIQ